VDGSGRGRRGFNSFGLEPGDASCNENIRQRIVRASLDDYWRTAGTRFDVITIWHVLEHLRDPVIAVQQMNDLLKDSGTLVIAVPTADGWSTPRCEP
jgi:SAM-dependent methyltransferase